MKTGLLNYRQKREGEKGWQKRNGEYFTDRDPADQQF